MPESAPLLRAGQGAHPGIDAHGDAFASAWQRVLGRSGASPVTPDRAADLYLATACDVGAPGAWEAFTKTYVPRLHGLLRLRGATEAEATDCLTDLPGYLCLPPPEGGAVTRIGTYDGAGHLFSWLTVVALRSLNQRRWARENRHAPVDEALDVASRRSLPTHGPLSEEATRRFGAALSAAWEGLTSRERLAVLWKHRDGLRGREIARLLGVGEPRVSRLLDSGLNRLRDAVRREMPDTPPGSSTPDESVWRALQGVLGRHLASLPALHDKPDGSP